MKYIASVLVVSLALMLAQPALAEIKASMPPLPELPQLSKSYDDMLKDLEKQGYGQYKTDPNKPLEAPTVENPIKEKITAKDLFLQHFDDLWTLFQLNKCGDINNPGKLNEEATVSFFQAMQNGDTNTAAKNLKGGLDWSVGWDLASIKATMPKSLTDKQKWLNGIKPSEGYDAQKNKINDIGSRMEEYKKSVAQIIADKLGVKTPTGAAGDTRKNAN